jgi:CAAX protease family protein
MDDLSQTETNPPADERAGGEQLPLWSSQDAMRVEENSSLDAAAKEPAPVLFSPSEASPEGPPLEADDPAWKLGDLGMFLLFAVGTFLLANVIATGVFLAILRGLGSHLSIQQVFEQTPFIVFMQVLWEGLWFLFIYFTITVKYQRRFWPALHWQRMGGGGSTFVVGGIVMAAVAQGLSNLIPSQRQLPIERLFTSAASGYLLAIFGICVAPFIEELVFRGFFYPVFEKRLGFLRAVLLTALLFAVIHGPQLNGGWPEMMAIFLVGVALSYTRGRTKSLVPSYLMHLSYNTSLFVSLYLTTDHFRNLRG